MLCQVCAALNGQFEFSSFGLSWGVVNLARTYNLQLSWPSSSQVLLWPIHCESPAGFEFHDRLHASFFQADEIYKDCV